MTDFKEKYKDLYDSVKDIPEIQLDTILGEQRGDDCGSLLLSTFSSSDLSLFLLSQKTVENGFIENYCLSEEDAKRLKEIRQEANNNPLWKETLIKTLEQYLSMPYEEFKNLDLGEQQRIIDKIKVNQEKEEKEPVRNLYLTPMLPTKYSREERERIRQKEAKILRKF